MVRPVIQLVFLFCLHQRVIAVDCGKIKPSVNLVSGFKLAPYRRKGRKLFLINGNRRGHQHQGNFGAVYALLKFFKLPHYFIRVLRSGIIFNEITVLCNIHAADFPFSKGNLRLRLQSHKHIPEGKMVG